MNRFLLVIFLLLSGCATRPGTTVSTQTCVGSILFGFSECVTVNHQPKLTHRHKKAMITTTRVAPAYGGGHEKPSISSSSSDEAYVASAEGRP